MSGVQCVRWHSRLADQRHVALRRRSGQQLEEGEAEGGWGGDTVTSKCVLSSAGASGYVTDVLS